MPCIFDIKPEDRRCQYCSAAICDERQPKPVSNDLEAAAKNYAAHWPTIEDDRYPNGYILENEVDAFKAGAQWLKEQMPCWKKGTLSNTPWGINSDYLTNPEGYYIELSKLLKLPKED